MPPMFIHPHTFGHPHMFREFNRVFILLYNKMFSYFRGSHGGLSDLGGVHMPHVHTPIIHLDTPICSESFNRLFILLYHKMFSYLRGSHRGLSDLGGCPYTPMFIHPHTFGHPHMFNVPKCMGYPNIRGHPNIQGAYKHRGNITLTTPHDYL